MHVRKPQSVGKHSWLHFVNCLIRTSFWSAMISCAGATGDSAALKPGCAACSLNHEHHTVMGQGARRGCPARGGWRRRPRRVAHSPPARSGSWCRTRGDASEHRHNTRIGRTSNLPKTLPSFIPHRSQIHPS